MYLNADYLSTVPLHLLLALAEYYSECEYFTN